MGINDETKCKVAVKIMYKQRMLGVQAGHNPKAWIECIRKEIEMMKKFRDHSNIVRLIDVIETRETVCTVMEYCAGGEYFDLISKKGRLPEE